MASGGYPGGDLRGPLGLNAVQLPYHQLSSASPAAAGDVLKRSSTELERQQQIYRALFQRTVRPRISPAATPASSTTTTTAADLSLPPPEKSTIRNRLQELERQMLDDDDEDEASVPVSAITATEWSETMQQLISSPSPTSSTASSSTATAATPSRQLLLETATAVADGNMETAAANIAVLKRAANPRGDPEQRLTAMMVSALLSRINPGHPLPGPEGGAGAQHLFDLCPCFKLGLLAANLAILDATRDANKVHILDFDVGQGSQHAALVHALARRGGGGRRPPSVKITAVSVPELGDSNGLRAVGDRIARLAERMGVGLRFSIVRLRPAELNAAALGCEPGEALSVNLAFQLSRVADESVSPANPRDEMLRRVRALNPRVVALVEQEVNGNTAPFAARFAEACGHYGALLEALDATAGRESAERVRAEAWLAGRAGNSVAKEGAERVERCEVFGKWRARMGMAGLRPVRLGPGVVEPVRARLASLRGNPGFTVREEAGGLCFGWMGRVITVASAWR